MIQNIICTAAVCGPDMIQEFGFFLPGQLRVVPVCADEEHSDRVKFRFHKGHRPVVPDPVTRPEGAGFLPATLVRGDLPVRQPIPVIPGLSQMSRRVQSHGCHGRIARPDLVGICRGVGRGRKSRKFYIISAVHAGDDRLLHENGNALIGVVEFLIVQM